MEPEAVQAVEAAAVAAVTSVGSVALKLPPFQMDSPEIWFSIAEGQFHLRKITDNMTRYCHTIAALDTEAQKQILDIMMSPQAEDKYQRTKERLIATYGLEPIDRAAKILAWPNMTQDERPSIYINGLLSLASDLDKASPFFIASVLSKLPANMRKILRANNKLTIKEMAEEADRMWQADRLGDLEKKTSNIYAMQKYDKPGSKRMTMQDRPHVDGVCPYHQQFGFRSKTCRPPCKLEKHVVKSSQKHYKPRSISAYVGEDMQENYNAGPQ